MKNEAPHNNLMPGDTSHSSRDFYARDFRVIGYDLEAKGIDEFELESEEVNYLVVGKPEVAQPEKGIAGTLNAIQKSLQSLFFKPIVPEPSKLAYTPDSIKRLRQEAQEKRRESGVMPTAHNLSQILRAVGAYLDLKEARLLRVSKQGPWVTLQYEVEQGNRVVEEFLASDLYDFCVRMYMQRKGRKKRS